MSSIEKSVEDYFKDQLKSCKIEFFNPTDHINDAIDSALKKAESKSGGEGRNFPDLMLFIETMQNRRIPVMIEAKGTRGKLIKYKEGSQIIDLSTKAVQQFAVNGAIHYALAILKNTEYKEVVAVGINGVLRQNGSIEPEFSAYYLSKKKENPEKIEQAKDFSFFSEENYQGLVEILDELSYTEEELEARKLKAESTLEEKIQEIHQSLYTDKILKNSLDTDQKLFLFCGLIMASLPIDRVRPFTVDKLEGNLGEHNNDGTALFKRIKEFLEYRGFDEDKRTIVENLLGNIFVTKELYMPINDESVFKRLFGQVQKNILPCFDKNLHLDFAGKIFDKLSQWVSIAGDPYNDVVLTPRYVTQLMAKLAKTDKDSYVLDSAMGSAGFLVSAMEIMIRDARNKISNKAELEKKIKHIKQEQICGVEVLNTIFMLAIMNMILMDDGSSRLKRADSLSKEMEEPLKNFGATVFLLNPPYSADGRGLVFVQEALDRMTKGRACVLIQENVGTTEGKGYPAKILEKHTLLASIHMPLDLFFGRSSVQTAIYLFEARRPHEPNDLVKFIDFSVDGYDRGLRKKSSQKVNLQDIADARGRYAEIEAIILNKKKLTNYFTKENGLYIEDTISLNGNDWTFAQHTKPSFLPTISDFKKTVKNYLDWKVTQVIKDRDNCLGKT